MRKKLDPTNQKFTRLTVIKRLGTFGHNVLWLCRCDCGKLVRTTAASLFSGQTKSCSCYSIDLVVQRSTKHNHQRRGKTTTEYKAWQHLKHRCMKPSDPAYCHYGGRGIVVCEQWLNSFQNFIADMGLKPTPDHSIDRVDNDGPYSPENCRWATCIEQANNRRKASRYKPATYILEHAGAQRTLMEWSIHTGIKYSTLLARVKGGWPYEKVLTQPVRKKSR